MVTHFTVNRVDILAQATGWWEMGARFRSGGADLDPTGLLIVIGAATAVVMGLLFVARYLQEGSDKPYHGPRRMFWQLCHVHRLSWRESWLLWRLARAQGLKHAAWLFMEPERFAPSQVPAALKGSQADFKRLRLRLFAPSGNAGKISKDSLACEGESPGDDRGSHPDEPPSTDDS